jgi:hypothetical protein
VGGWLVGLPFTSAPVALILTLDQGKDFAVHAALGTAAGTISQAAFCLAYAWSARRTGWSGALLAGCMAFVVATAALLPWTFPILPLAGAIAVALLLGLLALPRSASPLPPISPPRWDLPARMVVATAFVLILTSVASQLGARLAGLLAPFPLYAAVLAGFAHRIQGPEAAVSVLRGLLAGLFAFGAFFLVLVETLPRTSTAVAFLSALLCALAIQGCSLLAIRSLAGEHATRLPESQSTPRRPTHL